MPISTEHLAEDMTGLRHEIKDVAASVNDLRADFAGFRGAVETELQVIRTLAKWVLAAFTSIAIVALTGGAGLIWQAGALSAEVRQSTVQLEKRIDKMDQRFDRLEARLDRVDQQVIQLDKRMDKLEAKIDQRFDQVMQRLDQFVPKSKAN